MDRSTAISDSKENCHTVSSLQIYSQNIKTLGNRTSHIILYSIMGSEMGLFL